MRNGTKRNVVGRPLARGRRRAPARLALALALAPALAGCTDRSITAPEERLSGAWTWLSTQGWVSSFIRTPESEGYEQRLVFTDGGDAILFRDGQEVTRTTYTVGVGAPGSAHEGRDVVRYAVPLFGPEEQGVEFPEPNLLALDDGCCDGFIRTFEREGGE
jgi:hypothetical protein